jgi:hypothetical protein
MAQRGATLVEDMGKELALLSQDLDRDLKHPCQLPHGALDVHVPPLRNKSNNQHHFLFNLKITAPSFLIHFLFNLKITVCSSMHLTIC